MKAVDRLARLFEAADMKRLNGEYVTSYGFTPDDPSLPDCTVLVVETSYDSYTFTNDEIETIDFENPARYDVAKNGLTYFFEFFRTAPVTEADLPKTKTWEVSQYYRITRTYKVEAETEIEALTKIESMDADHEDWDWLENDVNEVTE